MKIVLFSHPSEGAGDLARLLVSERLAACVQVSAPVTSTYRWEGEIRADPEVQVWCKTDAAVADALMARILALHPYQVPEILLLPVEGGLEAYREWVLGELMQSDV
ncbi:MAG: divalent-cation tolerance protein CutA [Candidatus Sericytochromatia bacterium]|nr:divalent-cation tolerance protein CutA [Candidatus Tanganyikabacteria bacterium]